MTRRGEGRRRRGERAARIVCTLRELYPEATTALAHGSAFELLVATVLSAQCTDARVNLVTPALFARFPTARDLSTAVAEDVEAIIRSTGFYHVKARNSIALAEALVRDHDGEVPASMEALTALPGVGRKTANVVLGTWFCTPSIPVDTHVLRVSARLGLTVHDEPAKVERDLMTLVPAADWTFLSHGLILHGRAVCKARKPLCESCALRPDCPREGVPG